MLQQAAARTFLVAAALTAWAQLAVAGSAAQDPNIAALRQEFASDYARGVSGQTLANSINGKVWFCEMRRSQTGDTSVDSSYFQTIIQGGQLYMPDLRAVPADSGLAYQAGWARGLLGQYASTVAPGHTNYVFMVAGSDFQSLVLEYSTDAGSKSVDASLALTNEQAYLYSKCVVSALPAPTSSGQCSTSAQCSTNEYCDGGYCAYYSSDYPGNGANGGSGLQCNSDSDCIGGESCAAGGHCSR